MTRLPSKILIVDDEPDLRTVMSHLLASRGFLIETVADGGAALEAYKPGAFALVLVDQCLADKYGWEVAEAILAKDPQAKVLMMTGNLDPKGAAEGWPKGVLGWIEKPFTLDELLAMVERRTGRPLGG